MYLLSAGADVTQTAADLDVNPSTIHRWRQDDYFEAALNQTRQELVDALSSQLLTTAQAAARIVAQAVEGGDVRAALAVLKGLGFLAGDRPAIGPTTPAAAERVRVRSLAFDVYMDSHDSMLGLGLRLLDPVTTEE